MNKDLAVVDKVSDLAIMSPFEADRAIMEIADREGDQSAIALLAEFDPAILAMVIRQHDISKPSFLGLLVSPDDVVRIMSADPGTWEAIEDKDADKIFRDMSDIITGIILSKKNNGAWLTEFFKAAYENDSAFLYMAVPFILCGGPVEESDLGIEYDEDDPEVHTEPKDDQRIRFLEPYDNDGEIGEVYRLMEEHAPYVASEFIKLVTGEAVTGDIDRSYVEAYKSLHFLKGEAASTKGDDGADIMFVPLPD